MKSLIGFGIRLYPFCIELAGLTDGAFGFHVCSYQGCTLKLSRKAAAH
jgi:hypothetical protein